jgi:phosphate transport system permease protein
LTASDDVDQVKKGNYPRELSEDRRRIKDIQLSFYDDLEERGKVKYIFNIPFLTRGDSREPELAGVGGSLLGSFFTIITVLILSFPIGILSAIYLQEFAKSNRITDFIEININNLAAVPSIVFGLLGLGIILNVFEFPRSTPLVGGMVLALLTLPRIIIPTRAALRAVPPSIREGALAVGATKMQTVMHHVVPLAMPGALTGTIIGLAQALGETAPLLLIGMVAFVVDVPTSPLDASASLPVQVYLWAESAERGYVEKTSATIMLLLLFLILMNLTAVIIRRKFETKW